MSKSAAHDSIEGVAIIGMSGRFPGANNIDEFWQNLRDGVESISFFSDEELEAAGGDPEVLRDKNYVKAHGTLEGIESFAASFFGFNPREAEIMDPQHRLFLECAWQALESAGYDSEKYSGSISVFAGVGPGSYAMNNLFTNRDLMQYVGPIQASIRNRTDHLTTQVAYKLNLKGSGVTVQTACSTSLVAVHLACQSLLNGECDMSMAGGVSIAVPQKSGYMYQEGGILSPDGHCRAFDAEAGGTVAGSGVGIVVLKRLEDALEDGDCIYAVIRGSAINNDGSLKVGYTAPGIEGQAEVIAEALAVADVDPATISYIEAHGTGTTLGDPIEIEALTQVFRGSTENKGFCAIGAVKSNVGHLDTAAGVAGLIKTVLSLKHKQLPPSLHYKKPNPRIDFENSPFFVNSELRDWQANGAPRRAGVSSFGIGGTNAHVVLEEAPVLEASDEGRPWQALMLSTKTNSALEDATADLADYLKQHPDVNLADVAYTLNMGRRTFGHRRAIICRKDNAVQALEVLDPKLVYSSIQEPKERPIVFMFSGQGAQYVNMGLELYQVERTFREQVDQCCELLKPHLEFDLREVLYPDPEQVEESAEKLKQTYITQPALFVIEYALARQWMEWGVQPEAMIGHSIGEYVAACLAGVFTLEEALALVAARGRLMQSLPGGAMLAVPLPEKEVQPLLGEQLSLAAINGASMCVASGPTEAVEVLEQQLTKDGLGCRRLHTSHAFHSQMMEPILDQFIAEIKKVALKAPQIPYLSNVTGTWIQDQEAKDPNYWAKHLRQTVRFSEGVHELVKEPDWILLEVGPGRTLMTIARWYPNRAPGQIVLTSLPHATADEQKSDVAFLLTTLGRLWIAGVQVNWSGFYTHQRRQRIPLPTYPFERKRYWIEARPFDGRMGQVSLRKKPNITDWFYVPSWKRSAPPVANGELAEKFCWLLFVDACGLGSKMVTLLEEMGQDVISVQAGEEFARIGDREFKINPRRREDYDALLKELHAGDKTLEKIVHLWNVTPTSEHRSHSASPGANSVEGPVLSEVEGPEFFENSLHLGFYSLVHFAQALGGENVTDSIKLAVVTNNMQEVIGDELLCPEKATVIGPCRAISQEYPNVTCQSIDITLPESENWQDEKLADYLIEELLAKSTPPDAVIAYRGHHRWVQDFAPVPLNGQSGRSAHLREGGVYLITGGLGGIGLELAEYLAQTVQAKLILTGRSAFPERQEWDEWLANHDDQDKVSYKIRKVQALEQIGAEVLVASADVADKDQMQEVITRASERFGQVHGVIHAAGIAGGGMIQLKTQEMADSVLAPKVKGSRVLEALFKDAKLDFLALFSSRSSILGGFGQVDYCAANAFLDAFAHYKNSGNGAFTVSINWAGWQEVGMRVDTMAQLGLKADSSKESSQKTAASYKEIGHPLLAKCIEETPEREVYSTEFSVATHWVLDDHRIARQPIIPGTTYLEMVRAALERHAGDRAIELKDVYFLSALPVRDDETKEVRAVIEKNGKGFEFRVISKADSADGETWQEYVIGKAEFIDAKPKKHNIKAFIERCNEKEVIITDDNPIVTYEDLGPRWLSLKKVYLGKNELVAILELPAAFTADVETYKLHPALLDRANFTAKFFLAFEGLHLPLGYKGLLIKKPLPGKVYAYAKYKPNDDPLFETITFDVILMDENGLELVVVDEFSQKRVREVTESIKAMSSQEARKVTRALKPGKQESKDDAGDQPVDDEAMSPKEGVDAFIRIISSRALPQVVVSPVDLLASIQHAQVVREKRLTEEFDEPEESRPKHERPDVETAYVAPRNEVEQTIAEIWQDTLGIEQVGINDNFFELGGDSVVGIQMIAKFKKAGFQLSPQQLFQNQTIAELTATLDTTEAVQAEQGAVTGPVPLTPSQRWFFEQNLPQPHHFNQALLFNLNQPVNASQLQTAVQKLLQHHDALRLRFKQEKSEWRQENAAAEESIPFTPVDLSILAEAEQEPAIEAKAAELQASLNLSQGPLVRFAYFDLGTERTGKLLIVSHYLVLDSVSWWILLNDLDTVYQQLSRGEAIELPLKTSSFKQWAERLSEYAQSAALREEAAYWLAEAGKQALSLPVDFPEGGNSEASAGTVTVSLDVEETQALLHEAPQVYHAVVNDVLLTALVQACARWTEKRSLLIDLEDHGREGIFDDMDLSRTVGSFRSVYPAVLDLGEAEAPGEALKSVKEQLRRVPNGGLGYGLLRYLSADAELGKTLQDLPQTQLRFSFMGQFDQVFPESSPFAYTRGSIGPVHSPQGNRSHLLDINGLVHDGRLHVDWTYSENLYRRETIERLAQDFMQALRSLIEHCQSPEAGGYTPSDFPLADVDQQQLDKIAQKFKSLQTVD